MQILLCAGNMYIQMRVLSNKNDWQASIKLNNGHPCRQLEKMAMCESKKNNFKVTDYNNIKVTHDWY